MFEVSIELKSKADANIVALALFHAGYAPYLSANHSDNRHVCVSVADEDVTKITWVKKREKKTPKNLTKKPDFSLYGE